MSGITTAHISSPFRITIKAKHYIAPLLLTSLWLIFTQGRSLSASVWQNSSAAVGGETTCYPTGLLSEASDGMQANQQPHYICQNMQREKSNKQHRRCSHPSHLFL